ncbi:D-2-hydroxyacid dehydrogenase [Cohnella lubricantis]|uniref:D-2-hydroxyacid dehydrogenase n=1 Tax=Cohnella lubricantis TaxID=2163172 RepID=A0A841TEU6_9BACL|nr:D-2-hydroxyacid dehydrogenase [Cohnella lubricantis]MBB6679794.1 D-2-hydroxyacid dehydrogenase [Cohnella lubricantis]MBP2120257.1 phosphoglycerate dehydrogenase-like enzyme [Cohnella lubricantis]
MPTLISMFGFTPEQERAIAEAAPGWKAVFAKPKELSAETLREAEVICGWHDAVWEQLSQGPSALRWVQTGSAGVDNLPLSELEKRGVVVTTASGVHPVPMAETAFAMLLSFTRKLHLSVRKQLEHKWEKFETYGELHGSTMGIIGAGQIGAEVARLAQAFGMRTLGVRRSGKRAAHFDKIVTFERLDEVLAESDVVVNIVPATEETNRLFDSARFERMKAGAIFVNIGRGSSVDTDAMVEALRSGHLGGAGLDVFDPEPLPEDHPLWEMDNVIITPHIGGLTEQYKQRLADIFVDNLRAYLATGTPGRNVVDYRVKY